MKKKKNIKQPLKQPEANARIGGFNYKICFKRLRGAREGFKPVGVIDFDTRQITLDPHGVTEEEVYFSLFHEILHASVEACLDNYRVRDVQDDKFIHPFSRIVWDGMISAGLIDKKWEKK